MIHGPWDTIQSFYFSIDCRDARSPPSLVHPTASRRLVSCADLDLLKRVLRKIRLFLATIAWADAILFYTPSQAGPGFDEAIKTR